MLSKYIYTYISVSVRVYLDAVVLHFSFFFGLLALLCFLLFFSLFRFYMYLII